MPGLCFEGQSWHMKSRFYHEGAETTEFSWSTSMFARCYGCSVAPSDLIECTPWTNSSLCPPCLRGEYDLKEALEQAADRPRGLKPALILLRLRHG